MNIWNNVQYPLVLVYEGHQHQIHVVAVILSVVELILDNPSEQDNWKPRNHHHENNKNHAMQRQDIDQMEADGL